MIACGIKWLPCTSARMRRDNKERLWEDAGLLFAALSTQVHAQSTPKTVTLVVPYAAGGGTDTVARLIGERMSHALRLLGVS